MSLKELQRLGVISKVCSELENHLGFSDKTLAEFIIHLAESNPTDTNKFQKEVSDNCINYHILITYYNL